MQKELQMNTNKGISLLEVILAGSVFALFVTALASSLLFGTEGTAVAGTRMHALFLAEEGFEAARNIRDASFSNLTNGTYGLGTSSNQWAFIGGSDTTDLFTRSVALSVPPARARRVRATSTISWQQNVQRVGMTTLVTELTDWRRSFANWALPSEESSINISGAGTGIAADFYMTATGTYAVMVNQNSAGGSDLFIFDITNPAAPIQVGSLNLGASKPHDLAVIGTHALVASADNLAELQVVDISNPALPLLLGGFDASGNANALTIVATGTTVFLARDDSAAEELLVISIATPTAPTLISSLELGAIPNNMALTSSGQLLYFAMNANSGELSVVNVSNPSALSVSATYDVSGNTDATAVSAFGFYAAIGQDDGAVLIFDMSTPTAPLLISSTLDIGSSINDFGMGVGDTLLFAGTKTGGAQLTVIDVALPSVPTTLSTLSFSGHVNDVRWDFDLNRLITVVNDPLKEFSLIRPN
jgi:Tfp pilus assembly protein PilV